MASYTVYNMISCNISVPPIYIYIPNAELASIKISNLMGIYPHVLTLVDLRKVKKHV